jgi:hypothetical protein
MMQHPARRLPSSSAPSASEESTKKYLDLTEMNYEGKQMKFIMRNFVPPITVRMV